GKSQSFSLTRKHHTGDGTAFIFQRKIDVARCVVFTVADFPLDPDLLQQEILGKHIFNIGIYLLNRINALSHHCSSLATAPRIPLIKEADSSWPNFFASSTASLMATFTGTSSSYFSS